VRYTKDDPFNAGRWWTNTGDAMEQRVVAFADGRVFSGAQAKALGMVDELGGLEEALNGAAKLAGLPSPPRVIQPRRRFSVMDLLRSQLGLGKASVLLPTLPTFKTPLYLLD